MVGLAIEVEDEIGFNNIEAFDDHIVGHQARCIIGQAMPYVINFLASVY